jgi:hypothetical protein
LELKRQKTQPRRLHSRAALPSKLPELTTADSAHHAGFDSIMSRRGHIVRRRCITVKRTFASSAASSSAASRGIEAVSQSELDGSQRRFRAPTAGPQATGPQCADGHLQLCSRPHAEGKLQRPPSIVVKSRSIPRPRCASLGGYERTMAPFLCFPVVLMQTSLSTPAVGQCWACKAATAHRDSRRSSEQQRMGAHSRPRTGMSSPLGCTCSKALPPQPGGRPCASG